MRFLTYVVLVISINVFAQIDSENKVYEEQPLIQIAIDIMPQIIGGLDSLEMKINYPLNAYRNKIEGKVYILAMIDTLGNPLSAEIIKGIGYGCNEEAIRLIMLAKFTPAIDNGKKIKCQISIPIRFKLPKQE